MNVVCVIESVCVSMVYTNIVYGILLQAIFP